MIANDRNPQASWFLRRRSLGRRLARPQVGLRRRHGPRRGSTTPLRPTRGIGSVSDKVLTDTLRYMERRGLITRELIADVPIEVDYELTPLARELQPLLRRMDQWAHRLARGLPHARLSLNRHGFDAASF
jgi:hypothetical protein